MFDTVFCSFLDFFGFTKCDSPIIYIAHTYGTLIPAQHSINTAPKLSVTVSKSLEAEAHIRLAHGGFVGEILGRGYEYEAKMTV